LSDKILLLETTESKQSKQELKSVKTTHLCSENSAKNYQFVTPKLERLDPTTVLVNEDANENSILHIKKLTIASFTNLTQFVVLMLQIFLSDRLVHRHPGVHRIACTSTKLFLSRALRCPFLFKQKYFPTARVFNCVVLNPS
jgi:hypothetical protein